VRCCGRFFAVDDAPIITFEFSSDAARTQALGHAGAESGICVIVNLLWETKRCPRPPPPRPDGLEDLTLVATRKSRYLEICHPTHPEFRLETSPFYLMAHADFDYHEDMSLVLARHGVDRSMYRIMTVLREQQPSNIGLLAERALMKRNTASRVIERMTKSGLVTATENVQDSRVTDVALTPRGRDLLNTLTPIVGRQFQRAVEGIGEEGLEQLVTLLQKICRNLTRSPIEALADAPPGARREALGRLPPGQVWAAGASRGSAAPTLARIEVAHRKGRGVRLAPGKSSVVLRQGLKAATGYLHEHSRILLGEKEVNRKEWVAKVTALDGSGGDAPLSLGLLLALCSSILRKPLRSGLVVVGELTHDGAETVKHPVDFIGAAVEQGARRVLLPVSWRRAAAGISDEVATQLEIVFFVDVRDALGKALQE
jgi:MarR family transcriptional regulator, organic hydroperoxide resistance regulator